MYEKNIGAQGCVAQDLGGGLMAGMGRPPGLLREPAGEVREAIEQLRQAVNQSEPLLQAILQKLKPVMGPESPEVAGKEPNSVQVSCELSDSIMSMRYTAVQTNRALGDILSRLRL